MTDRNHYSLWQETRSWQEPYNNCPIGFIFFNRCANFQIIFSYRASVFLNRFKASDTRVVTALPRSVVRGQALPQTKTFHLVLWTEARGHSAFLARIVPSQSHNHQAILYLILKLACIVTLIPSDCLEVWIWQGSLCNLAISTKSLSDYTSISCLSCFPVWIVKHWKERARALPWREFWICLFPRELIEVESVWGKGHLELSPRFSPAFKTAPLSSPALLARPIW